MKNNIVSNCEKVLSKIELNDSKKIYWKITKANVAIRETMINKGNIIKKSKV